MAESDTDGSSSIEELPPAAAKKAKTAEKGAGSKKAKKKKKREPRHKWTQEEDYFLLKAIKDCGSSNWSHTLHALQKDRHQLIWAKKNSQLYTRFKHILQKPGWIDENSIPPVPLSAEPDAAKAETAHLESPAIKRLLKIRTECRQLLQELKAREEMVTNDKPDTEAEVLQRVKAKEETREQEKSRRLTDLQNKVDSELVLKRKIADELTESRKERARASQTFNDIFSVFAMALITKTLGKDDAAPVVEQLKQRLAAPPAPQEPVVVPAAASQSAPRLQAEPPAKSGNEPSARDKDPAQFLPCKTLRRWKRSR